MFRVLLLPPCRILNTIPLTSNDSFPSSGYLAAVFARITGPEGRIVGIDYLKPLAELSEANVRRDDPTLLSSNRTVTFYLL